MTCDFKQCGFLTSVDSKQPVEPPFKQLNTHRIFKRLANALIRLRICAGWPEPLLVTHTLLLEISCRGSLVYQHACITFTFTFSYDSAVGTRGQISTSFKSGHVAYQNKGDEE